MYPTPSATSIFYHQLCMKSVTKSSVSCCLSTAIFLKTLLLHWKLNQVSLCIFPGLQQFLYHSRARRVLFILLTQQPNKNFEAQKYLYVGTNTSCTTNYDDKMQYQIHTGLKRLYRKCPKHSKVFSEQWLCFFSIFKAFPKYKTHTPMKKGGILAISIKVHIQENCEHYTGTQCLSMVDDKIKGFFFLNGLTILLLRMCTLFPPRNQPIISKREQNAQPQPKFGISRTK